MKGTYEMYVLTKGIFQRKTPCKSNHPSESGNGQSINIMVEVFSREIPYPVFY